MCDVRRLDLLTEREKLYPHPRRLLRRLWGGTCIPDKKSLVRRSVAMAVGCGELYSFMVIEFYEPSDD